MADKTLSDLITGIETELHQVAGPATQIYGQDMLIARINDAFITFFEDKSTIWKRFLDYTSYTLNGINGTTTTHVDHVYKEYNHIVAVYPADSDHPLVAWNTRRNPSLITGTSPVMIKPTTIANKIFQVLPITATGNVTVLGRVRPANWPYNDLADIVEFDYLAIQHFVVWQELADEGANPSRAEDVLNLFKNRWAQLVANQEQETISYNGGSGQIPTQWRDRDA
jgi:hypothetical protein